MTKENAITQENFEMLLGWLDRNRDDAGQKYEKIRRRLIRIFIGRGCFEAEELADETINRVTQKAPTLAGSYVGEPVLYFYSVANKIHLEWLRKQKKLNRPQPLPPDDHAEPESEAEYQCLEACLKTLPPSQHQLIVEYYGKEKSAKIEKRRTLAEKLDISISTLQVKVFRIRARLKECVQNCIAEKA